MTLVLMLLAADSPCVAAEATIDGAAAHDDGVDFCIGHDCWHFDAKTVKFSSGAPPIAARMPSEAQADAVQICARGSCKQVAPKDYAFSDGLQVRANDDGSAFALFGGENG